MKVETDPGGGKKIPNDDAERFRRGGDRDSLCQRDSGCANPEALVSSARAQGPDTSALLVARDVVDDTTDCKNRNKDMT